MNSGSAVDKADRSALPASPELLAPAGSLAAALAAFDAGADSVYAGLHTFSARQRARNLDPAELGQLVAYARRLGRRVYVTVNTLVKEHELTDVAALLGALNTIRPHAVIVQDLGVLRLIRSCFPELTIHASTQMGVHNSTGVQLLARLGVERVILQRQVTAEEIRRIVAASPVEVEVFAHGALCCSRSGVCLFSSWLGGWSGNRGRCKQPCRRRFFTESGNGFFFSTNDLCLLEHVPELRRAGVAALKIEGRLRGTDYVQSVVTAYRTVLDAPPEQFHAALKRARSTLSGALGRKWSKGFWSRADADTLIQHDGLGSAGLLCGRVARVDSGGFRVKVSRPFDVGDTIRVQPASGEEGPALTVTRLVAGRRPTARARKGETCFVHCDKPVPADGYVFKIAGRAPDLSARVSRLPPCHATVDLDIAVDRHGIRASLQLPRTRLAPAAMEWSQQEEFAPAKTHPLEPDTVADAFRRSDVARVAVDRVRVSIVGKLFVPARTLKLLCRAFWQWIDSNELEQAIARRTADAVAAACEQCGLGLPAIDCKPVTTVRLAETAHSNPVPGSLTCRPLTGKAGPADEVVLPHFCPEHGLSQLREAVAELAAASPARIRICSLFGLQLVLEAGLETAAVTAGFPLPVTNSMALHELVELGVRHGTVWVELERDAVAALAARAPGRCELFAYGRPALLETRAGIPVDGIVTDSRGTQFTVRREADLTRIFPKEVMEIPTIAGISAYLDLSHARWGEKYKSPFNFDRCFE